MNKRAIKGHKGGGDNGQLDFCTILWDLVSEQNK